MGQLPSTVVVVAGGVDLPRAVPDGLAPGSPVVAADSGVDAALALGLRVDLVVGDLDSVSPTAMEEVVASGATVERHPADKDATDLALALGRAVALVADGGDVVVLGCGGGRLDHLVAGLLALADPAWTTGGRRLRAHLGDATVHVVHGPGEVRVAAAAGDLLTIVPVGGDAVGVRTAGLRFALRGERLPAGTTRGVSNVVEGDDGAVVGVAAGTVLVVLPASTSAVSEGREA
jgi:thiamine pyrophosphokinase